jgi:hypothetical protein
VSCNLPQILKKANGNIKQFKTAVGIELSPSQVVPKGEEITI